MAIKVRCINAANCENVAVGEQYTAGTSDDNCYYIATGNRNEFKRYLKSRFVTEDEWQAMSREKERVRLANHAIEERKQREIVARREAEQRANAWPVTDSDWTRFIASGRKLKFRSGCPVKFVAFVGHAKPHCRLVLLSAAGNVFFRCADGRLHEEAGLQDVGDVVLA